MKPTIHDLHESGQYRLIESFKIDDMMQFLARELGMAPTANVPAPDASKPKTLKQRGGQVLFLIVSAGAGWFIGTAITRWGDIEKIAGASVQFLYGLLAFMPLISVHELIHGVAFKRVGAPRVGYGWSWKGMMAYAYAQNHVLNMREVAYVAAMPFVIITTAITIAWFVWPQYAVAWGTLLFLHTFGCLGDFVLINFWRKNQHRAIYTYDDVEGERKTYFFERVG